MSRSDTAHTAPALTKTAAPNPYVPAAVVIGKIYSNCARPRGSQTASSSTTSNKDIDVMSVASIEASDGNSDYVNVKLTENSPTSPANMPDLEGHINELEKMHKVT